MIIFDLDTLADSDHRQHFVDPKKNTNYFFWTHKDFPEFKGGWYHKTEVDDEYPEMLRPFKHNWKSFHESCDKDKPIHSVTRIFKFLENEYEVQIWSGRCESVREKTREWLYEHMHVLIEPNIFKAITLKMRPIGDNTPYHELKKKWLDEELSKGNKIEFVFDSDPKSIEMWKRRGIFVFDCNQGKL